MTHGPRPRTVAVVRVVTSTIWPLSPHLQRSTLAQKGALLSHPHSCVIGCQLTPFRQRRAPPGRRPRHEGLALADGRLRPGVHVVQPPDGPAVPLRRLLRHDPRRRGQRRRALPVVRRHAAQPRRGWRVCHTGLEPQTSRSQAGLLLTRVGLALDRAPPDVSALTGGGGGGGGFGGGGGAISAEEMASVVLSEILSPGLLESLGASAEGC